MTVTHATDRNRFEADLGPDGVAYLAYSPRGDDVLDLQHTIVPDAAQGRGVGTQLVAAALDHAREHGMRIVPSCPFVAEWLDGHPEAMDLVVSAGE